MHLTPWLLILQESTNYGVAQGSVIGPILFSLFSNGLPLHVKNISVDCDLVAHDTTLHTSGEKKEEERYSANQKQYAR